ncbi:MAG: response regulator [Anaeromassilibacillus sp.]
MIHMLVVDDEAEEREGILFLLHKYGFNMETGQAPNGKAALDYLKNRAVDILFTDVRMPFMDGLTLAKEALLLQPNIRVILFSGFSEFEYAKTAISLGVREYILKPVNVEEFCTVMQRVSAEILSAGRKKNGTTAGLLTRGNDLLYSLVNGTPLETLTAEAVPVRSRLFESIYQHGLARVQPEFFRSRWARIL